ncbi:hypothetical protein HCN44_011448 [Aphidius gifuensis]|uniref:Mitochondrial-processing peptidase subunit alpha n=1 Tax=Aphidius gifuensis TaxID=684658 RepID=A0A834XZQ9_APHGI|nr:mitochondrial-processing peptidase subunit alpha [Aphidius gifuensis]KAF7994179.1 hypothetical protein HCN44_011448 [Aphidius gifuensis]
MISKIPQTTLLAALKNSSINIKHFNLHQKRCFTSTIKTLETSVTGHPPLSQSLKNIPNAVYVDAKEENQKTEITTLSNGLKVATEKRYGKFCTVGVLINAGSRFEASYPHGISHFLEKLAFNSTKHYENKDDILVSLEKHGGICDCQASRDTMIYAASAERSGLNTVTKVLGDIVLRPRLTDDEIKIARQTIEFELESLATRPEQEFLIIDMIHAAAYGNSTLGLPKICPKKNIETIDSKIIYTYLKNYYSPKRMVIAASGVDHNDLVNAVKEHFVEEKPIWDNESSDKAESIIVDDSKAKYTGGYLLEACSVPVYAGPSGLPELSHAVIGLESCSHQDPDFVAACILNIMMGGGGSFSAGGPGKGMYTRLYTNVLNRYHWLYSATAFNHSYSDTGLFCIHASSTPNYVKEMIEVIIKELVGMAGSLTDTELARAKKQLQSMLLMNLEQRPVVFEDIGRQVLATGFRRRPEYFIQEIEKITKEDVQRVARRFLKSPPSVAVRGKIKNVPSYNDIQAGLLDNQGLMPGARNRLSLFC